MRVNYRLCADVLLRFGAAAALSIFTYRVVIEWISGPPRIVLLLLLIGQFLTVGLVLISRLPSERDWQPLSVICSVAASFYFLALDLTPGVALLPQWMGALLQSSGIAWQIYAKWSLGRAFGLLPANRGVVTTGAYRWVRHPIYSGYFTDHVGFLLASFTPHNLLVLMALDLMQVLRILQEERILKKHQPYRDYCQTVRYRFWPSVW